MKIIEITDALYPQRLKSIKDAPQKLYVEGNVDLLNKPCLAVVGARKSTEYGRTLAKKFSKELSEQGICIVSGLAEGIDTYAHIGAVREIGKTIAVLGGGIKNIFPKQNENLAQEILDNGGCIISEHEPNEEANMEYFPTRNRIISGISMGVLIVEARHRSGSGITAKYAIKQGKTVFCIPRDIDKKTGVLPNGFIKSGAELVTSSKDILEYYSYEREEVINEDYKEIYSYLTSMPITVDELCRFTNLSVSGVNERLMLMEIEGIVKNVAGGYIKVER